MTNIATSLTLDGFDPFGAEYVQDPQVFIRQAHESAPVFYYPPMDLWVVTRHDDVSKLLDDWRNYSSAAYRALPVPAELRDQVPDEVQQVTERILAMNFVNIDPPTHTIERKNAQKWFTRSLIAESEPRIRSIASELIDGFVDRGECDLMQDYTYPLALRVIIGMIGVPEETLPRFRTWVDDFFALMAPKAREGAVGADEELETSMPLEEIEQRYARVAEASEFFTRFLEERRANPKDDLASAMLLATNEDGTPAMTIEKVLAHMLELTAAGSETTASLIAHIVRHLTLNPHVLEEVQQDPSLWEYVVEEGLRRGSISPHLVRITTSDVEIGGVRIPSGSKVLLHLAGGNADEECFENALTFDIHRANRDDHVALGHGRHKCMGAPLARLEARCALEELYRRIPSIRVTDPSAPLDLFMALTTRGFKHLPVSWSR